MWGAIGCEIFGRMPIIFENPHQFLRSGGKVVKSADFGQIFRHETESRGK